ncbi:hypothetical protein [Capnocytophaga canis]
MNQTSLLYDVFIGFSNDIQDAFLTIYSDALQAIKDWINLL